VTRPPAQVVSTSTTASRRLLRSRIPAGVALVGGSPSLGSVSPPTAHDGAPTADPADRARVERFADADTTFDAGRVEADIDRILALGTAGR
jgi:hypothetical protein